MRNLLTLFVFLMMAGSAHAALIIVDRADDLGIAGDGGCDLREAVNSANLDFALEDCAAGEADTLDLILIDVDGPIQLQSEIDVIRSALIGSFGDRTSIEIIAGPNSRHFHVNQSDSNDDDFAIVDLHLKNGSRSDYGGSIWVEDAGSVDIVDSIFENNEAPDGGAIYVNRNVTESFELQRNQFINNRAVALGGAVFGARISASSPLIARNLFLGNSADKGGAIFLSNTGDDTDILRNRFYANTANDGGALYLSASSGDHAYKTARNVYLDNVAEDFGGAIFAVGQGLRVEIVNSTLGMNQANEGGAIVSIRAAVQVYASTLAHNSAVSAGSQAYQEQTGVIGFAKSILAYGQQTDNCSGNTVAFVDNIDDDGSCGFDPNDGNLVADPLLTDLIEYDNPNPDVPLLLPGFELTLDSPAIDYEDNSMCWIPPGMDLEEDQNGQSRDVDGNDDGIATCDLGALEAPENNDAIFADRFDG